MSYRSIKRVLGETSLERKCFFLFGIGLLLAITAGFWWYSSQTDELVLDATRRTAAGLKTTVLFRRHLKLTHQKSDEQLFSALGEEVADDRYEFKFLRPIPKADDPPLDDEEAAQLEFFTRPVTGALAGRAADWPRLSLLPAHLVQGVVRRLPSDAAEPNRHPARRLDRRDGNQAVGRQHAERQTQNRAYLMATAIMTVFGSMVTVYLIMRYVVVKPLAHLREVSDEISRGNTTLGQKSTPATSSKTWLWPSIACSAT